MYSLGGEAYTCCDVLVSIFFVPGKSRVLIYLNQYYSKFIRNIRKNKNDGNEWEKVDMGGKNKKGFFVGFLWVFCFLLFLVFLFFLMFMVFCDECFCVLRT